MDVVGAIRAAISQCGREAILNKDEQSYKFTACIQPKSACESSEPPQARFGWENCRRYSYYGPLSGGGELVEDGAVLTVGGEDYEISRCHDFYYGEDRVFRCGTAQKLTGGGSSGSV